MMRTFTMLSLMLLFFVSCSSDSEPKGDIKTKEPNKLAPSAVYPEQVSAVFEAHGGIQKWKEQQALSYEVGSDEEGWEKQRIDLSNRKEVNEAADHIVGYDGKQVWVQEKNGVKYEGRAIFSYNLMFYFYAMPFVVGDDRIRYTPVEPITLEGKTYDGFKIAYDDGVGFSSKDEYIIYYHPETKRMEWLAYTVTYFSKEKSQKFNIVHYKDWTEVNGLTLPAELVYYKFDKETATIGDKRGEASFKNVELSTKAFDQSMFEMPEGAKAISE